MIHYLLAADRTAVIKDISWSKRLAPNFSYCFRFNYLKPWKKTKSFKNRHFATLPVTKRNLLLKIRKRMVTVWSWYLNVAFQRIFSDFPFLRSSQRKMTTFHVDVEKVTKLDGTRVSLDYEMRCEALRISIIEKSIFCIKRKIITMYE